MKVYQYTIGGETLHRGYYCPSLIKDIVIGNCNRGRLVRNTKKAKKITYEYGICDNQLSLNGMEGIKMVDITEIMDMLDWHMPSEIQLEGISLARNIETIIPFIQPLTPKHNKNVWDNCAVIIAEKSDEKIKPHLVELLEWLQDMNWPGAFCILDRLKNYSDNNSILSAISICLQRAKDCNDGIWEDNLLMLQEMLL